MTSILELIHTDDVRSFGAGDVIIEQMGGQICFSMMRRREGPISERTVSISRHEPKTSPQKPVASEMRPYPILAELDVELFANRDLPPPFPGE
jgi:hypothetical protein